MMNDFLELAKKRCSVRNYDGRPVEAENLEYILECGRIAPSAANRQPWHIFVITGNEIRNDLSLTYNREWFRTAPVILVFCGDHSAGWKRGDGKDHTDIDVAIIADHITLAAADKGLGTCWICNFDTHACSRILDLPPNLEPVAYMSLGYPSSEQEDTTRHHARKRLGEIVTFK